MRQEEVINITTSFVRATGNYLGLIGVLKRWSPRWSAMIEKIFEDEAGFRKEAEILREVDKVCRQGSTKDLLSLSETSGTVITSITDIDRKLNQIIR